MNVPRYADLPIQIKRLNLSERDIVVARVDPSTLRGNLHRVAAEVRKALVAGGHSDTILLVLPSDMDLLVVSREEAIRALECLASTDASGTDRLKAIEAFNKEK